MYLFREFQFYQLFLFSLLTFGWVLGGWLLGKYLFRLRPTERFIGGIAAGFLIFISLGNLLAQLMPLASAFGLAAGLVLMAGVFAARTSPIPLRFDKVDLKYWQQLAAWLVMVLFFWMLQRGVAIFDEFLHLPLVSVIAAGDLPPKFYLDPSGYFAYHYGLHLFASQLVRLAGFFPWSAWDLSKAIVLAFTFSLASIWFFRLTRSRTAAVLGAVLVGFVGGTRWILLFLPGRLINEIGRQIDYGGGGIYRDLNFVDVLSGPWIIEGGAPVPFPFAYHSGIFTPVTFVLGSTGALPFMTILLLLLLNRRYSSGTMLLVGLIFSTLALSAEHVFITLWLSIFIMLLLFIGKAYRLVPVQAGIVDSSFQKSGTSPSPWLIILKNQQVKFWGGVLILSAVLSLFQGGFITEIARGVILQTSSKNTYGFALIWPPALVSGHLGELSLFNFSHFLVLLAELGPAVLLAPLAIWVVWKYARRGEWLITALGTTAWLCLILPLFFRYGVERAMTRMPAMTLWLWVLLAFPFLYLIYQPAKQWVKTGFLIAYAGSVFAGLALLSIQMTALPLSQPSYFLGDLDAQMSMEYWDRLPSGMLVFDPVPYRAVTLFGQATYAHEDIYTPIPAWQALRKAPDPVTISGAGYDFIYYDESWWNQLSESQQSVMDNPCAKMVAEMKQPPGLFRILMDIRNCSSP